MKRKLFGVLRHSVTMVRRNLRSYRLLSVTIVMSFALLLGYLGLMDSQHYNRFKYTFAQSRNMVFLLSEMDPTLIQTVIEKAGEIGNTQSQLLYMHNNLRLNSYGDYFLPDGTRVISLPNARVYSVPSHVPEIYRYQKRLERIAPIEITWLDGKEHPDIHLEADEVIVDEQLYHALEMDKSGLFRCMLEDQFAEGSAEDTMFRSDFTVVGTVPSEEPIQLETFEPTGDVLLAENYQPVLILSNAVFSPSLYPRMSWYADITFVTDSPEQVDQLLGSMLPDSATWWKVYESQDRATEIMRTEKGTKAMIGCVLLALLSINLYSSFSNALNDRKFEIGVKRAMGASAFSIVRQFLYESMIVMLADILLAVVIVTDGLLVYKAIYEATPDRWGVYHDWIIYISPYSIAMFVVGSVAMTVVFSLIFAYKSTQVEIVEYLKAE